MELAVFIAVLTAAALHASWNALVKHGPDKHVAMAAIVLGHLPLALAALAVVPAPDPRSWPYIAAGTAIHIGYQLCLLNAYRIGDLTQVYPIARGVAPMIVAGVSLFFLGVDLGAVELIAILTIATGIMSLVLLRGGDGLHNPKATAMAVLTGCFIAGYSLVDGLGARLAGSPVGFYGWLTIFNAMIFTAIMAVMNPRTVSSVVREARWLTLLGGGASFVAYALVVWAFTMAPIAHVTALRETSIIFALLLGALFLRERLTWVKVVSVTVTVTGIVLLRIAR